MNMFQKMVYQKQQRHIRPTDKDIMKNLKYAFYVILAINIIAFAFYRTNSDGANKALLDAGYTDVTTGGYDHFACGEGYARATKFTATSPNGKTISSFTCHGQTLFNAPNINPPRKKIVGL